MAFMKYAMIILGGLFFLFACNGIGRQKLLGKWQAASIMEDGMPMPVPVNVVGFEFFPNGFYHFTSTLEYKEAGTFDVNGSYLFTLDTINEASTQKSVQILQVTEDSLFLKMNAEGKEQVIKLFKIKTVK
jgi:hypothetical protein